MTLCWVSTVASALIAQQVASPTRRWEKKPGGKAGWASESLTPATGIKSALP